MRPLKRRKMRGARILFTYGIKKRCHQATKVRLVRSRLEMVKRVPIVDGGIAMSAAVRGWGYGVETRALHSGAEPRPDRFQM